MPSGNAKPYASKQHRAGRITYHCDSNLQVCDKDCRTYIEGKSTQVLDHRRKNESSQAEYIFRFEKQSRSKNKFSRVSHKYWDDRGVVITDQ